MSYQVIARKYRPQRFQDVVGQEHVTQTLSNAILQNRIAHAYLFVGPRGTGKTTLARIFAKCLNCTGGPKVDYPDTDPKPVEIAEGRSLDVLEIDGASNRGIEEIRELRETVKYAPASSRFKIYIIDEVHMLTKEAFNALLKTLEEPPAHVKFMFATTEPEKVLPTILSRCQRFDLRRIPSALIVKHLHWIAGQEGVEIEENALYAIARGADGGMRDAESTLDQLISFCGEKIVEPDVLSMFGLAARGQILSLAKSVLEGETEKVLRELDELARNGKDLGRLLGDLLGHFRNLLLFRISKGDRDLVEISESETEELKGQSERVDEAALIRIMDILAGHEGKMREAASKRIVMEIALLQAIQVRNAVPIETVLKTLQGLRTGSTESHEPAAAPSLPGEARTRPPAANSRAADAAEPPAAASHRPSKHPEATAPPHSTASQPAPPSTPPNKENLEQLWAGLLDAVGRVSAFTRSYLIEAHPVSLTKNVLTIGFDPEFADHLGLVDNMKTHAVLQTKLRELGAGELQVKFVKSPAPPDRLRAAATATDGASANAATAQDRTKDPGGAAAAAIPRPVGAPLTKEDFKNDPLIKQALEVFKGTIVEVRT